MSRRERALRPFLYLERPEGMELPDARGFVPTALPASRYSPTR
jgi:hypothetical protein